MTLSTIILDSADPKALGDFYATATGWPITSADDDFVYLGEGVVTLAIQRVENYRGPAWPDAAKHSHLDFKTADVDGAIKELLAAGAILPEFQPGGDDWTILQDPEGHAFCVMAE